MARYAVTTVRTQGFAKNRRLFTVTRTLEVVFGVAFGFLIRFFFPILAAILFAPPERLGRLGLGVVFGRSPAVFRIFTGEGKALGTPRGTVATLGIRSPLSACVYCSARARRSFARIAGTALAIGRG